MSGTDQCPAEDTFTREIMPCPICGVRDEEELFFTPERIVQCRRCGLVYTNPRLDAASLARVYTKEYFVADAGDPGVDYPAYADYMGDEPVILRSMHRRMQRVEQHAPRIGSVLDVGCAAGFSLAAATARGWQAEGIECSDYCVNYARSRGLTIFDGSLAEYAASASRSFEAITMWDYLEHSTDPVRDLSRCHDLLAPGGVIVLSIPNVDSWSYRLFGRNWIGFKNIEHFYFFSRKTLAHIGALTGFEMVDAFYQGKYVSLSFLLSRVQYYTACKPVLRLITRVANHRRCKKISFYVNPFDILNVVLRRVDHPGR